MALELKYRQSRTMFLFNFLVKGAARAVFFLVFVRSLDGSSAKSAGDIGTRSTTIFPVAKAIRFCYGCGWTNAQLRYLRPARLATALLGVPTILLTHGSFSVFKSVSQFLKELADLLKKKKLLLIPKSSSRIH